jgi:hypothetical protein
MMADDKKFKVKRLKSFLHGPQLDKSKENYDTGRGRSDIEHIKANVIDNNVETKMFGVRVSRRIADFESLANEYCPIPDPIHRIRRNVSICKKIKKQCLSDEIESLQTTLTDDKHTSTNINQNTTDRRLSTPNDSPQNSTINNNIVFHSQLILKTPRNQPQSRPTNQNKPSKPKQPHTQHNQHRQFQYLQFVDTMVEEI